MRYTLEKSLFNLMLKFVIAKNQNPDASRCNVIEINIDKAKYQITICFNERKNQIAICEIIDEFENEVIDSEIANQCLNELTNMANNATIDDKDSGLHIFYRKKIEPATECCELNQ